jgi:hypothetical protein
MRPRAHVHDKWPWRPTDTSVTQRDADTLGMGRPIHRSRYLAQQTEPKLVAAGLAGPDTHAHTDATGLSYQRQCSMTAFGAINVQPAGHYFGQLLLGCLARFAGSPSVAR